MEAKARTRRQLDAQAWREVFHRFDGGGESVVGFCKREGLNKSSFHRWRQRLAATPAIASTARQVRAAARPSPAAKFIEMGSMSAAGAPAQRLDVRLELGGGLVLQLVRG